VTIAEMQELFAYDSWANARFFAEAEALTDEQLNATAASSFPSLRGTIGHIAGAEWIWLRRWHGESPEAQPAWVTHATLPEIKGAARRRGRGLTDARLNAPLGRNRLSRSSRRMI
jgi:uncharacterized damage-inducible protein DinB